MKITADSILGSAQNINNKKKSDEKELKQDSVNSKNDSISIKNAINSRIETIEKEVKEIQTSLTKNQMISRGLDRLLSVSNPAALDTIMNETLFNNNRILKDFVGPQLTADAFKLKKNEIDVLISSNLTSLTKIQVEMDNIAASNVISNNIISNKKIESLMVGINDTLKNTNLGIENISNLDAEKVMRLIK
ncbi:MAG: hypothetical protein FWF73_07095 [Spirochaetes bacterium]|nr:hypothetical protein [Spirochaetota bacterium]